MRLGLQTVYDQVYFNSGNSNNFYKSPRKVKQGTKVSPRKTLVPFHNLKLPLLRAFHYSNLPKSQDSNHSQGLDKILAPTTDLPVFLDSKAMP